MTTRGKITIIILAVIIVLAGGFFLWYSLTVNGENPLKIVMDDTVFSGDENISFKVKNNSLNKYCFAQTFYKSSPSIASGYENHTDYIIENYDGSEWTKISRPSVSNINPEFRKIYGTEIPELLGMGIQIFNSKINLLSQRTISINKKATFSYGEKSYTWELPDGKYRLLIYYGKCQGKGFLDSENYFPTLKTVTSPAFEVN